MDRSRKNNSRLKIGNLFAPHMCRQLRQKIAGAVQNRQHQSISEINLSPLRRVGITVRYRPTSATEVLTS